MKKIFKYSKILFINLILIVYLIELVLFLFLPDTQKKLVEIHQTRLNIAKELGLNYDIRTPEEAFVETRQNNPNLSTAFYFNKGFANYKTFQKALSLNKTMPFRGPINKQTLSCAEDLNYKLINNDKFGFKNPNTIYEKKIEIVLLGDSYTEGQCYKETNDIAAYLRKSNYNSANLGVTGSGPLVSLGVLKEYAKKFQPDFVIYLYYEGNDISDLSWEKNVPLLKNYLNKNFTQNLLGKENEIKKFLSDVSKESHEYINYKINFQRSSDPKKRLVIIEQLKDFLELTNLRNYIKNNFYLIQDKDFDADLFYSIINIMNEETNSWGGKFIFVYTPSWARYFTKFSKEQRYFIKKKSILNNLEKNNILTIDLTNFLDQEENLKQYFPLGYVGHFNKEGYKKISSILINKINN
tara:strand:- start:1111 stop:2340 length:1230 start_codon:yes stop_codon:yes gene_type:complete